jgi:DNA-binding transcriptional LysR family regulator
MGLYGHGMEIELRHLRVLVAIAEAGSVTKAAGALGLAPAALTAQLQRIERNLGGRLFDRDRHGTHPTVLGDHVLARARVLLPAAKELQESASVLAGAGPSGTSFRIGATNGPIVGGLVPRLEAEYPLAHVSTHTSWSSEDLAEMLQARRIDFAVIGLCGESAPPGDPGLTWRTVAVDAVCVLMSDQHPAAALSEVDLSTLAPEQWANAPGDGCFNDCFSAACARAGFTPKRVYETDVAGCLDLLGKGAAVVLCQGTFRRLAGVAMVPIAGSPLSWRHVIGWHPAQVDTTAADLVLREAASAYREIVERNPRYAGWLAGYPSLGVATP